MDAEQLNRLLKEAAESGDDCAYRVDDLAQALRSDGSGTEAVEPILRTMEDYPEADFGTPGGLVHFLEKLARADYQAALLASLERRPTTHTIWMLHRLYRGHQDPRLLAALRACAGHPSSGPDERRQVADYLDE